MKITPETIEQVVQEGKKIKLELFQKLCEVQEGHPGSILSIFDVVNALYLSGQIRVELGANTNDAFIMSKGHAAAVQYPYLVRKGLIPQKEWDQWGSGESILRIFANKDIPGIDVTSGSLGHGVGIAAGMSLANRMNQTISDTYVVISEGELYEGSTWEALLFVSHHNLTDVKIILDVNKNMILGRPEDCLRLESIDEKFKSFDFEFSRIDGHSYPDIFDGLAFLADAEKKPRVLIADTIKGKGVSFMEDRPESHYWGALSEEKMNQMILDLSS